MKAVFLDRDGVINRDPGGTDYVKSWEEFSFLPRVKEALKQLNSAGYQLFIISNQAGVAKGLYSQETLGEITANLLKEFADEHIKISGVYYCTHRNEDNCSCRKPKTGLIEKAISDLQKKGGKLDLQSCYFVGDTIRDVDTGKGAGLKTILVFSGKEKPENRSSWKTLPDFTAGDLFAAAGIILKQ